MTKLAQTLKRPATLVLTTRIDARYLATLAMYWNSKGENPTSVSELARLCMESFSELLTINNQVTFVPTQEEALEILDRMNLMVKRVNPKNLALAMQAEGISLGSLSTFLDPKKVMKNTDVQITGPSHEIALASLESRLLDQRLAEAQDRTQEFKDSLGMLPDKENE
jgi:hypothetical protein